MIRKLEQMPGSGAVKFPLEFGLGKHKGKKGKLHEAPRDGSNTPPPALFAPPARGKGNK